MTVFPNPSSRFVALDLTKGVLVVCMIVYHGLNYSTQRHVGFMLLPFLPPSFILITGFLISHLYRPSAAAPGWRRTTRLLVRGIKLLALFTLLNVLAQLLVRERARGQMPDLATFWSNWFGTYVSGDGRLAVFEVLLPIAYLLLLAPILLWFDRCHRAYLPVLTVAVVATCALVDANVGLWMNAQMWSAGLVGMVLGRLSDKNLKSLGRYRMLLLFAYIAYVAIELVLHRNFGYDYFLELLGAGLVLAIIYGFSVNLVPKGSVLKRLDLLGRYSLVSYILQIGILQVFVRWQGRPEPTSPGFLTLLFGTLLLTIAAVEMIEWSRRRSAGISLLYKAIFA